MSRRITNATLGQCPAVAPEKDYTKYSRMLKTLKKSDVIEMGIYAGETVNTVLKRGFRAVSEVLKYYNLCDEIMEEYHYRLRPHQETKEAEVTAKTVAAKPQGNTAPAAVCDDIIISEEVSAYDALNASDIVELDDDTWTSTDTGYQDDVLYDPEDDMDSYSCHPSRRGRCSDYEFNTMEAA